MNLELKTDKTEVPESERGKLIASFAPMKVSASLAILNYSLGMLLWFAGALYNGGQRPEATVVCMAIGCIFAFCAYRMATRHKRPVVVVYEKGIWCRFDPFPPIRKFRHWHEIENVEQIAYYRSQTMAFRPGFGINFKGIKRRIGCYQILDGYRDLYRLLYENGVDNASTPLELFDIDHRGDECDNRGWYTSIYYPDRNKTVKFKGRPVKDEQSPL